MFRSFRRWIGVFVLLLSTQIAHASELYDFKDGNIGFSFVSPSFVTDQTTVSAAQLLTCATPGTCFEAVFTPDAQFAYSGGPADRLNLIFFVNGGLGNVSGRFAVGAFGALGHYQDLVSPNVTLDVSSVPLPGSLPLMAAGILALGLSGRCCARERRSTAV